MWFFDRLVRVLRVLKAGVRRARVTEIGDEYVRVDIEGVRWGNTPGQHTYVYFPTLNPLRPWENHPFSLLPTSILQPHPSTTTTTTTTTTTDVMTQQQQQHKGQQDPPSPAASETDDPEKAEPSKPTTALTTTSRNDSSNKNHAGAAAAGITLIIRKSQGMTASLRAHDGLLALLDGPYPNNPTGAVLRTDRLVLVGGGIGITGLLPWTRAGHPNVRLCWSVRASAACLARELEGALAAAEASGLLQREVRVGGPRIDVAALLEDEARAGWAKIGVVVCGPGGLCDDVRAAVAQLGRREKGVVFELEVDAYSW